jgi:hypothetical protein
MSILEALNYDKRQLAVMLVMLQRIGQEEVVEELLDNIPSPEIRQQVQDNIDQLNQSLDATSIAS